MAAEEESVLFTYEGDGTSALDTLDELDAALLALDERIALLADSAGQLSILDDAFVSLMDSVGQVDAMFASLVEAEDSAASALDTLAGAADALQGSLAGADESIAALDESLVASSTAFADHQAAILSDGEAIMTVSEVMDQLAAAAADASAQIQANAAADSSAADAALYLAMMAQQDAQAMYAAADAAAAAAAGDGAAAGGADALAASEATAAEATTSLGDALQAAQGGLMLIAMGLAMAVGKLLQMGSAAEDAFAQVQGLAGATSQQMAGYTSTLQQYAVQFGTSLAGAAQGLYYVLSAGFKGAGALNVLKNAMMAASAGGVDVQTTADAVTGALNAYAASADKAQQYTDYMTEAVTQGKQTYGQFASAIGAAAVTGNAVGISFDQVAAAESALTRSSMDSHKAVLDLDFMLRAIALGGGSQAAATAKKLGLSFDETTYKSLPLIDKLNYLKEITHGNQTEFEKLVGGSNGFMAAQALLTNETGNYNQILDAMHHSLGVTQNAFEVSQQTITASLGHVQGALSDVGYQLTVMIAPYVTQGLNALSGAFAWVAQNVQNLQPVLIGLAVFISTVLVLAVGALATEVVIATWPFLAIAAVIAGVVAALVWLNNTFPPVHAALASVGAAFQQFGTMVSGIFDAFQRKAEESTLQAKLATINNTISQKQALIQHYEEEKQRVEQLMQQTTSAVAKAALEAKLKSINAAEQQANGVISAAEKQKKGVEAQLVQTDPIVALHTLKQKDASVSQSLIQAQQTVSNLVRQRQGIEQELKGCTDATQRAALEMQLKSTDAALKQKESVVKSLEQQKAGVEKSMKDQQQIIQKDSGGNALITMWQNVSTGMSNAFNSVKSALAPLSPIFTTVWQSLQSIWKLVQAQFAPIMAQLSNTLHTSLIPAWQSLQAAFKSLAPVGEFLLNALKGIGIVIGGAMVLAVGILMGTLTGLANFFGNFIAGVIRWVGGFVQFFSGMIQVITGFWMGLWNVISDIFHGQWGKIGSDIQAAFGQMGAGLHNMVAGIWQMIQGAFQAGIGAVLGFLQGFVSGVYNFFKGLWDKLVGHSIVPDMINGIVQWFQSLPGKVLSLIEGMVSNLLGSFGGLGQKILSTIGNMVSGVTGQTNDMAIKVGLQHQTMALSAIQHTQQMAVQNVAHLDQERRGILAQLQTCKNESERHRLEMKLKAVTQAEQQQIAVVKNAQKEKEDTLKHIEELKQQAIEAHKSMMEKTWDAVRNGVGKIFDTIGTFVHDTLDKVGQLKDQFIAKLGQLKDGAVQKFQDWWTWTTNFLSGLPGQMLTSGEHMLQGFIDGITNKFNDLKNAISNIAGYISSHLHFSVPDEGPLSTADKWMPDMMELFSQGITANQSKIRAAMLGLGLTMQASLQTSVPAVGGAGALSLPSIPSVPSLAGTSPAPGALGSSQQFMAVIALLEQVVHNTAGVGGTTTNISMSNTIASQAANNPQQLLNLLLGLGGANYQSFQRGSYGI